MHADTHTHHICTDHHITFHPRCALFQISLAFCCRSSLPWRVLGKGLQGIGGGVGWGGRERERVGAFINITLQSRGGTARLICRVRRKCILPQWTCRMCQPPLIGSSSIRLAYNSPELSSVQGNGVETIFESTCLRYDR